MACISEEAGVRSLSARRLRKSHFRWPGGEWQRGTKGGSTRWSTLKGRTVIEALSIGWRLKVLISKQHWRIIWETGWKLIEWAVPSASMPCWSEVNRTGLEQTGPSYASCLFLCGNGSHLGKSLALRNAFVNTQFHIPDDRHCVWLHGERYNIIIVE